MKTKIAAALMIITAGSVLLSGNTAGAEERIEAARHHRDMPPPCEFRDHHHGPHHHPPHDCRGHHHHGLHHDGCREYHHRCPPHHPRRGRYIGVEPRC